MDKPSQPTKPPFGWFRFHLSTTLMMVLMAGCLLWINFHAHRCRVVLSLNTSDDENSLSSFLLPNETSTIKAVRFHSFGWPMEMVEAREHEEAEQTDRLKPWQSRSWNFQSSQLEINHEDNSIPAPPVGSLVGFTWRRTAILINVATALLLLLAIALLFEISMNRLLVLHVRTRVAGAVTVAALLYGCLSERLCGTAHVRGWPLHITVRADPDLFHWPPDSETVSYFDMIKPDEWRPPASFFMWQGVVADVILILLAVVLVCYLAERRMRRPRQVLSSF